MKMETTSSATDTIEEIKKFKDVEPFYKRPYNWVNIILLSFIHLSCVHSIFYIDKFPKLNSLVFTFLYGCFGLFGVLGGGHRLWAHRSFKATLPLKVLLASGYHSTGIYSLYYWVRDHRVHHKYADTDVDPHNARKGMFYSHIGWLLVKKHPVVKKASATIDMSDFWSDSVAVFYEKNYFAASIFFALIIPMSVTSLLYGEPWMTSFYLSCWRMTLVLNNIWTVNSLAHKFGYRPYNGKIWPTENWFVSLVTIGEGWHNYHHTFPWDYRASEFGLYLNFTTLLIQVFACIGWAYDLRQPSENLVRKTIVKSGDGSHTVAEKDTES